MAKSLVEKFEQILAADPTSMVFVELAKSLLDQGDLDRAAKVCREGVDHHPDSILGRVLLGRTLLNQSQPEGAALEFERALAIDPDNPYGYNLVAETLIKQKLYAQAVPVLEKALALQPSDLRLHQWIAQAKSGGQLAPDEGRRSTIGPLDRRLLIPASDETQPAGSPLSPPPIPRASGSNGTGQDGRGRVADLLLADLPEPLPSRAPLAFAPTTPTVSEVNRIAQTYEDSLRAEFEEVKAKPKSFLRKNWIVVTLAATALAGLGGGLLVQRVAKRHLGEKHAADFMLLARSGLLQDSYGSLAGAVHQMNELLEAEPHRADALAVAAQAQAMICHDFGCTDAQRAQVKTWVAAAAGGDAEAQLAAQVYLDGDPEHFADALLKSDPQLAGPWTDYLAGTLYLSRHDEQSALKRFDLALKLQGGHVPTLVTVGEGYLQKGEPAKAADLFGPAHTASPLNVAAAIGLAEAHLATHELSDDDAKNLAQVVAAGPNTIPSALRQRLDFAQARVLASTGKLDQAVALLQDGVSQHGDEFTAYEGTLADCYAADGQYDRAETEAWRALSKSPKDPEALERYGAILLARGRDRDVLSRVTVVQNSRRLHVIRAQAALEAGNLGLARSEIEATRKDNKVPALAGVLLAEVEGRSGHVAEAKNSLRQIAALAHPPAEAFLGLAALEGPGTPEALASARKAVAADPRSYEAHCLLGRLLARAGKPAEAESELLSSIRLDQQHVEARIALGLLDLDRGKPKDARPILEAAVREAPQDPQANLALARVLLALSQNNEAVHAAARATKAAPQDPRTHHWLGKIALAVGDRKLALKELREAKKLDKKDRSIGDDLALAEHKKH